jgi:hypothetical protein
MNENWRYEVYGTTALATREERHSSSTIIDYDIARRSYEARQRLAQRQAASHARNQQRIAPSRRSSLQRVVEDAYTPERGPVETLGDMCRQACNAIASHPFTTQLIHGSLRGRRVSASTYRDVLSTSVVCVALSSLMIFVGA